MNRASSLARAALLAALLAPSPAGATAVVAGTVRTALRPLAGVHVLAPASGAYARSDSSGRFLLAGLPSGTIELRLVTVGFAPFAGAITVAPAAAAAGDTVDTGTWMLEPLRPDEVPLGFHAPPANEVPPTREQLDALPTPAPVAPPLGLFRTLEETTRWPASAGLTTAAATPSSVHAAFADLLRRVAVADSITAATAGTGAPGVETWRQWADRFAGFAADSTLALAPALAVDSSLVLRATAYARSRAALAAGPTRTGYVLAEQARAALARAARAGAGRDAAFLAALGRELDRVFVPGSTPPPAPPPQRPKKKRRRSR